MPNTTTTTTTNTIVLPNTPPPPSDAPPAYTPYTLPPYTHFDPDSDRRNYAIALLMHNLRMNGLPPIDIDSQVDALRAVQEDPDRVQRRAIRDYRASQDESQWGTRAGHGRGRRTVRNESEDDSAGWWSWVTGFFAPQGVNDQERVRLMYSTGIPMFVAPNGSI